MAVINNSLSSEEARPGASAATILTGCDEIAVPGLDSDGPLVATAVDCALSELCKVEGTVAVGEIFVQLTSAMASTAGTRMRAVAERFISDCTRQAEVVRPLRKSRENGSSYMALPKPQRRRSRHRSELVRQWPPLLLHTSA
jgi:hypothetical protein